MGENSDPGELPKRWLNCPRKSTQLIVDKFLAFKCPLSAKFDGKVPEVNQFHPEMILEYCKSKKMKLGLWIDLTNTRRFYNEQIVKDYDCKYIKLKCRGHGETPSEDQTNYFVNLVHQFISQNPLHKIAVHCTHGFNRTGFLIVSYLVSKMDFSLDAAIQTFALARPPGIYKEDYIKELYRRHDEDEDPPAPPDLPDWCFEDSDENTEETAESSTKQEESESSEPPRKKRRKNGEKAEFMAPIQGIEEYTEDPHLSEIKRKVQQMCRWKLRDFPGSQPVSMDMSNIRLLAEKPYRVSWKADGTRYMMLIDGKDKVFFFDRKFHVFHVRGLRFPQKEDLQGHLQNTLLDGEMVIDKVGDQVIYRYLIYDVVQFENMPIGQKHFFPDRLKCLVDGIIKPRTEAMKRGIINRSHEPISIRNKDFWEVTQAANLLGEKFAASLCHEPDGLIFQPSEDPYVPGRCDSVLKWKPLSMNSIDFRLKISMTGGVGIIPKKVGMLYVGGEDKPVATIKYTKDLLELDNKIVECKFENNAWKVMRERKDKKYPNSIDTAKGVFNSISNPVTEEYLITYITLHRYGLMLPPRSK